MSQVVTIDGGNDRVPQLHRCDGLRHVLRLGLLNPGSGSSRCHCTEAAAACADIAEDHERGRTVLAPTLVDVGASSLLTDRVQAQAFDETIDFVIALRRREPDAQPLWAGLSSRSACRALA